MGTTSRSSSVSSGDDGPAGLDGQRGGQRQVGVTCAEPVEQRGVAALHEVEPHTGVQGPVVAQQPRDGRAAEGGEEREPDAAVQDVGVAPDLARPGGELGEGAFGVAEEGAALACEAHGAAAPREQDDAEVGFQTGDPAAQRRLRYADRVGGAGHVLGPGHRDELVQPRRHQGHEVRLIHICIMPRPNMHWTHDRAAPTVEV